MAIRVALLCCLITLVGCDAEGGEDAGPRDAAGLDGAGLDAAGLDAAGFDAEGTPPVAVLLPAPPVYWYLDRPVDLVVGGARVASYRARFDGGDWSAATPVSTPLETRALAAGWHDLELVGGDAAGRWQSDAAPTTARFFSATSGREPLACTLRAAGGGCDVILEMRPTEHQYFASDTAVPPRYGFETPFDAPAGSVICFPAGTSRSFVFRGVEGSAEAPYTFTNCGGVARIALPAGEVGGRVPLKFSGSHHLRVVGVGSADERGLVLASGATTDGNHALELSEGCSDVEVAFVEIESSNYAGIAARTDVSCAHHRESFVQANTFIHDVLVHDTTGEGFYVGGSHWRAPIHLERSEITCGEFGTGTVMCDGTCRFESELHGVRIYRNRVERTDADGIQLSSARSDPEGAWDTEVWGNVVIDPATGDSPYNSGGITIQSGTSGRIHHNVVIGSGAFAGLNVSGLGHFVVYDNVVADSAFVGIVLQDDDAGALLGPFVVVGNTVSGAGEEGIYVFTEHTVGNILAGNLVVGALRMPVRRNAAAVDLTEMNDVTTGTAAEHFLDGGEDGFHLRPGSSAIDTGIDLSGWGVTDDRFGTERTAPFDVGAVVAP